MSSHKMYPVMTLALQPARPIRYSIRSNKREHPSGAASGNCWASEPVIQHGACNTGLQGYPAIDLNALTRHRHIKQFLLAWRRLKMLGPDPLGRGARITTVPVRFHNRNIIISKLPSYRRKCLMQCQWRSSMTTNAKGV